MADDNAAAVAETEPQEVKPTRMSRIFAALKNILRLSFRLLLLLLLIAAGFFLGIYLRVFDADAMNEKLELYKYPVLNEYFIKPEKTAEQLAAETAAAEQAQPAESAKPAAMEAAAVQKEADKQVAATTSKPVVLTKEEIDRQTKLRQAEEKKRISKLARLYNTMKPEDAAAILDGLNDDMVIAILGRMDEAQVAKVLVAFDTGKSSRLTRIMYNGNPPVLANVPMGNTASRQ